MGNFAFVLRLLLVAMSLATAWAVRGQFGHEHGAAWAGAIGVLAIVILSKRQDWLRRLPAIVALGAIGWGAGGMMSYGKVVGYAKSLDLLNVTYGLFGLFIIGALYGFIGGGLSSLALASTESKKVKWASLITQMVAGAYLIWGILIYQLEWLMTPPRSELWAACLGAAMALGWYAYRNAYHASFKTAMYSALGAGFGFAFGNFLQVLGPYTGLEFNWWNVMEYSLGFFGGLGMAYGVFSSEWEESQVADNAANIIGWVFLIILLPLTNIIQAFSYEKLLSRGKVLSPAEPEAFVQLEYILSWGSLLLLGGFAFFYFKRSVLTQQDWSSKQLLLLFVLYLGWYIFLSNIMGGIWLNGGGTKEYLYWANLVIISLGLSYSFNWNKNYQPYGTSYSLCWRLATTTILILFVLSLILVNTHGDLPGAQKRFVLWE
ncbi:hypothetical protein PZB74_15575 [Porifericola rhodea]|uniref:hypothetical protein n=1 Tax=Porifericola rhodea TaxID=930972 RepID=UPI002666C32B|nr:hypothetical protein [Porifericola rhodea]WKN30384.1 hypothetical protein PZB74_15575 [Porifericola rhodea]